MALDALGLTIFAVFLVLGAWRGALASGFALAALAAGYAAAVLAATSFGPVFATALDIPALFAPAVAGSVAFVMVFVACALARFALRSRDRERAAAGRGLSDRFGGACFGALRGAFLVVLLGWLAQWVDAFGRVEGAARAPLAEGSHVGALSQRAVELGVEQALGEDRAGTKLAARLLAHPAQAFPELQGMIEHPRLVELANDRDFWHLIEAGHVEPALRRTSFVSLAHDGSMRESLASLGVLDEAAASSPAAFGSSAREVFEAMGPRLRRIHEDPELQRLAGDREVVRLLEQRDILGLLQHPGFQALVTRILEGAESPTEPLANR